MGRKQVLKALFIIILLLIVAVGGLLAYLYWQDTAPPEDIPEVEIPEVEEEVEPVPDPPAEPVLKAYPAAPDEPKLKPEPPEAPRLKAEPPEEPRLKPPPPSDPVLKPSPPSQPAVQPLPPDKPEVILPPIEVSVTQRPVVEDIQYWLLFGVYSERDAVKDSYRYLIGEYEQHFTEIFGVIPEAYHDMAEEIELVVWEEHGSFFLQAGPVNELEYAEESQHYLAERFGLSELNIRLVLPPSAKKH